MIFSRVLLLCLLKALYCAGIYSSAIGILCQKSCQHNLPRPIYSKLACSFYNWGEREQAPYQCGLHGILSICMYACMYVCMYVQYVMPYMCACLYLRKSLEISCCLQNSVDRYDLGYPHIVQCTVYSTACSWLAMQYADGLVTMKLSQTRSSYILCAVDVVQGTRAPKTLVCTHSALSALRLSRP